MLLTQKPKIKTTFQLKGSMYTLTTLKLLHYDHTLFCKQLTEKIKSSPKFFENAPLMLDLTSIDNVFELDLNELAGIIRDYGMILIGIRTNDTNIRQIAGQLGIAIFNQTLPTQCEQKSTENHAVSKTKIIKQPIRSGQQIYAKDSDLVVLASVSPGAEILADGHIHVYGALRGRALAGVQGDINSYIFCQQFDAELVAIAGRYMISDDLQIFKQNQSAKIYLAEDKLQIEKL